MSFLEVSNISKQQQGVYTVKDVSFQQEKLQQLAIAGETGSGKSTLMKIIGGLAQADEGKVMYQQKRVRGSLEVLIPGHPGIAYLSQHFELRNNYRVEEILSYANKFIPEDAAKLYEICQVSHLLKRKTDQVSGGEKQRIALARLLTGAPEFLLLDEPYSNLDMIHKNTLKSVVADLSEELGITCMLISHDPLDLLSWADEIMVMRAGEILEKGTPQQLYHQPEYEYTAALLGKYNLITPAIAATLAELPGLNLNGKDQYIRPEQLKIVPAVNGGMRGEISRVAFFGSYMEAEVLLAGSPLTIRTTQTGLQQGDTVHVALEQVPVK
ncbi:ABC transporter ATP-binding protein [Chitinophaga nivalis]|uniref:ABC transporter ATP-binding protein n=1 Tax=Chitinophaga nivalis TaxID=2991709 RepID=A0ABT3IKN2_9BACT|nr:ABC transporter ATP-binding protein [Chitinophaga nivalis]MCW3465787.1 ABC transporter ATP-binding protein [Chitinophaga nivalis]MCW3484522.1 ABC transporter ATP-binding protein [Chitinophaga nivalis]